MPPFFQDLRFSARVLLKEKSFSVLAIVVLALGICGVTTQFSLVHAFLIRGLPVAEPEQLVSVTVRSPEWAARRARPPMSADYLDWTRRQTSFEGLASYYTKGSFIVVRGNGPAQRISGGHVTANFFSLLRVKPSLGRDFTAADNRPLNETERVTIISDAMWETEFARDPNILGRTFRLNGAIATVIGVMPADFQFTSDRLWLPVFNEYPAGNERGTGGPAVFGRLKSGVAHEQAAAEMSGIAQQIARDFPATNRILTQVRVEPLINRFVDPETRDLMLVMLGAVAVVLAMACVNITNLQFARAIARRRELAVRGALGASRRRLLAQMLTECLLLVGLGAAAGVLASLWTTELLQNLVAAAAQSSAIQPPPWLKFKINAPVLAFTIGAAALFVLLAGLLPAWLASRANPIDALRDGGRGHTNRFINRLTRTLVIAQIAMTCSLLAASLLLVRSIVNQHRQTLGYDGREILTARMNLETDFGHATARRAFYPRFLANLRSDGAFTHVALTSRRNLVNVLTSSFEFEGRAVLTEQERPTGLVEVVSDGYFATLGLRPIAGREFLPSDVDPEHPVVLVNAAFAKKYFGRDNPIGQRLRGRPTLPWATIVGVVPDTLMQGPLDGNSDGAGVYVSLAESPSAYITVVARGPVPPAQLFEPLRRAVAGFDPNLALYSPGTPQTFFEQALLAGRMIAGMFSVFALIAIVLAALGLYGVAAFAVTQRTHEFGIRMALGAAPQRILRMVLGQGVAQFAIGLVLGLVMTAGLVRLGGTMVESFLFKVSAGDPLIYGTVIVLLAVATLVACFVPARRATKVDPMITLRAE